VGSPWVHLGVIRVATVRKWPEKRKILQGQGKVGEFYFESGNIDNLKKVREN